MLPLRTLWAALALSSPAWAGDVVSRPPSNPGKEATQSSSWMQENRVSSIRLMRERLRREVEEERGRRNEALSIAEQRRRNAAESRLGLARNITEMRQRNAANSRDRLDEVRLTEDRLDLQTRNQQRERSHERLTDQMKREHSPMATLDLRGLALVSQKRQAHHRLEQQQARRHSTVNAQSISLRRNNNRR